MAMKEKKGEGKKPTAEKKGEGKKPSEGKKAKK